MLSDELLFIKVFYEVLWVILLFQIIISFCQHSALHLKIHIWTTSADYYIKECNRYPEIGSCLFVLRTARGGKDYLCTYLRQNHQLYDAYCRW